MPKRPERPRRSIRGRPRASRDGRDGLDSRSSGPSSEFDEVPQDEHTTWHPSLEGMDPGELTKWISGKSDQPDFERTDSRGVRRAPPSPDFNEFDPHEATGVIHTPKKRAAEPERKPRRRTKRRMKKSLPTPEPAPRRRTRKEAVQSNPVPTPTPRPTPRPPRPPTPEPAPPRRSRRHEARQADQEPSLTVPRVGRTPAPPPQRRRAVPSVGRTPSPRHPSASAPDHWTPAPAQRAFPNEITQDHPPEYPGFEAAADVPATVVSEDSVDEVPPSSPLPHIPNDAPTIVRPDMGMFDEPAAPPQAFEEAPAGEPTVALPAPSKRKNTQVRQPTPEPAPDALPSGASYTPPPEKPERRSKSKSSDKPGAKPRSRSKSKSKSRSKTPSRSKKSDAPKRQRKSRNKKQNWDLDDEQRGGVPMMWVVYGGVVILGGLLVMGAFIAGIVILVISSS